MKNLPIGPIGFGIGFVLMVRKTWISAHVCIMRLFAKSKIWWSDRQFATKKLIGILPQSTQRIIEETIADVDYESRNAMAQGKVNAARAISAGAVFLILKAIAKQIYETALNGLASVFRMN